MIHILTVHHQTDKFIDLQCYNFQKYTEEEHKFYAAKFKVGSDYQARHYVSLDLETQPQWKRHGERLNLLTYALFYNEELNASLKDEDLLIFVDADAYPIDYWVEKVRGYLEEVPLVAVQRRENIEPLLREEQKNYPHASFVATTVGFWKNNDLSWDLDHSKGADCIGVLLKEWLEENNHEWRPLLRTNSVNIHPLYFGIYDDMIYHHGAGNRVVYDSIDIWTRKELAEKYNVGVDLAHPEIPEFNAKLSALVYENLLTNPHFPRIFFAGRE